MSESRRSGTYVGVPRPTLNEAPLAQRSLPPLGTLVDGRVELLECIGKGAMGVVFRGLDVTLDREVAVKFVRPEWAEEESFCQLFIDEGRSMAAVQHPNVVEIYALGRHDGLPYFVMEMFPGQDLRAYLERRSTPISLDEGIGLLEQVCRGLAAIHQRDVIHRDLKPANVLVGVGFRVAIADFGLATTIAPGVDFVPGIGTAGFMAPEAFTAASYPFPVALRRDVYAVGSIAYELFTGRPAREGDDPRPPLDALRPELPSELAEVVERALDDDPEARTESAMELRRQLLAVQQSARASSSSQLRIVAVDDDREFLEWIRGVLRDGFPGASIVTSTRGAEALEVLRGARRAVLVTDLEMPGMDGFVLTREARRLHPTLPIVVVTGQGNARDWQRLRLSGADACALKPTDADTLVAVIRAQVSKRLAP